MGLLLALGGCEPEKLEITGNGAQEPLTSADVRVTESSLGASLQLRREDSAVRIGMTPEAAVSGAFGRPGRSTRIEELPPGFDESFAVSGWESGRRTFAAVAKEGQVVLALDQTDRATDREVSDAFRTYETAYGEPMAEVVTDHVRYAFWQNGSVRLMVVSYAGNGESSVTVALGLTPAMDRLGMNYESAQRDAEAAESRRGGRTAGTNDEAGTSE